ncbi:Vps62-related protein (plasmid) [Streptomyces sp. NBC_00597]|uniref:Vps62-related protein n=1 Tax=Streptomyces sp. NBC_00597 TaxID=2975786 RepID=UPI002F9080E5
MITQRYGDLEIGFTTDYRFLAEDLPALGDAMFWAPKMDGWWPLGCYFSPRQIDPRGRCGAMVLRSVPGSDLLAHPTGYTRIMTAEFMGHRLSFWRPTPPAGYVALGDLCTSGDHVPPVEEVMCVKKTHKGRDYVRRAEVARHPVWRPGFAGQIYGNFSAWAIEAPLYPDADTEEHLFVPAGVFTAVPSRERPSPTETTWVLDLPAIIEKGPDPAVPQLHSHDEPPSQTTIVTDRTVTVPYFMVGDDGRDEKWKVDNSPFYKVQRKRHYELILFRNNQQGSEPQPDSEAITTGVSREQGETFSVRTGISVSATVGVEASAKPFGIGGSVSASTTVSASVELGYERRYGITTMESKTVTRSLVTPPKCSGALWMERHELLPIRGNGDMISNDAKLPFRTVYYHTGQYPQARAVGEEVVYAELDENGQPLPYQIGIPVQATEPEEDVTG